METDHAAFGCMRSKEDVALTGPKQLPPSTQRLTQALPLSAGANCLQRRCDADACVLDQTCASDNLDFNLDADQRGFARPFGPAPDIGAYERMDTDIFADGFE